MSQLDLPEWIAELAQARDNTEAPKAKVIDGNSKTKKGSAHFDGDYRLEDLLRVYKKANEMRWSTIRLQFAVERKQQSRSKGADLRCVGRPGGGVPPVFS